MRLFLIFVLTVTISPQATSQDKSIYKPLRLELSLGYAKTGFYGGYENYLQDGGENDGNFEVLNNVGNNFSLKTRISYAINHKNVFFTGLVFSLYSTKSNLISGWTAETLGTEQSIIPNYSIEMGHRFKLKSLARMEIALSNSISFIHAIKNNEFNLRSTNLYFKPGIYIENSLTQKVNLLIDLNYGIGLTNSSESDFYSLRNNMFELNFGLIKVLSK